MAINRYDQPAEAQFINTYVPIPFDDIAKVALLKQARIDEDLEKQQNMLATYSSFKTAPGQDERSRDKILSEIQQDFATLQEQPGTLGFRQGLANITTKWGTDTRVQNLRRNQETYDKMLAEYNKAKQDKVPVQNLREMEETLNNYYNYGEEGLRSKQGSGVLTSPGYKGYVDVYKGWQERVNDVKPSSAQTVYNDKTGKYMITDKNAGITLDALSAPFGIKWKEEYKDGKKVITVDHEDFSRNGFKRLMETEEGGQVMINAKEELRKRGEDLTQENLMNEAYSQTLQTVQQIMSERVQSDRSIDMDADPYALAAYKKSLDDSEITFTNPVLMSTSGSKLTSPKKIDEAKNVLTTNIKDMDKKLLEFKEQNNIQERTETYTTPEGKTYTRTFYESPERGDMTDEYNEMLEEKGSYQRKLLEIQDVELKAKREAGLSKDYSPSKEVLAEADAAGKRAVIRLQDSGLGIVAGGNETELTEEEKREVYHDAYNAYIEKKDPKWKEYRKVLQERAAAKVEERGVTRFSTKSMNEMAETMGLQHFTENKPGQLGGGTGRIQWAQDDGKGFTNKDYENIDNAKAPEFLGWAKDPEDGTFKFIYRFYKKGSTKENPELMDAVKVDAPAGTAEFLIKQGEITPAEVYLSQVLSKEGLGEDEANKQLNMPGFGDQYQVRFETLTPAERSLSSSGTRFKLNFPVYDESSKRIIREERTYSNKQEAITDLIGFYMDSDSLREKGK